MLGPHRELLEALAIIARQGHQTEPVVFRALTRPEEKYLHEVGGPGRVRVGVRALADERGVELRDLRGDTRPRGGEDAGAGAREPPNGMTCQSMMKGRPVKRPRAPIGRILVQPNGPRDGATRT